MFQQSYGKLEWLATSCARYLLSIMIGIQNSGGGLFLQSYESTNVWASGPTPVFSSSKIWRVKIIERSIENFEFPLWNTVMGNDFKLHSWHKWISFQQSISVTVIITSTGLNLTHAPISRKWLIPWLTPKSFKKKNMSSVPKGNSIFFREQ